MKHELQIAMLHDALKDTLAICLSRGASLGLDDQGPVLDKARAALAGKRPDTEADELLREFVADVDAVGRGDVEQDWPDLFITYCKAKDLLSR